MTTKANPVESHTGESRAISFPELSAVALTLGLFAGTTLGMFEALRDGPPLTVSDALTVITFTALPAAASLWLAVVMLFVALRVVGGPQSHHEWVALTIATVTIASTAALVLVATWPFRNVKGVLILLASLPVAVLAYSLAKRIRALRPPGCALAWSLASTVVLLVLTCSLVAFGVRDSTGLLAMIASVLAIVSGRAACSPSRRSPARTNALLAFALPLLGTVFFGLDSSTTISELKQELPERATKPPSSTSTAPPNIVILVLDTTRRDHFGAYGHPAGLTPNFDRLAKEGVLYLDAVASSPWTVPAHASLFTGLYPRTHGASSEHHKWLDDEFTTIAEILRADGYQTMALYSNIFLKASNLLQGFDRQIHTVKAFEFENLASFEFAFALGAPTRWIDKGGTGVLESLSEWFRNHHDSSKPVFLFVNFLEPHDPYLPPIRERAEQLPDEVGYWEAARMARRFEVYENLFTKEDRAFEKLVIPAMYRAEIKYQDRRLGETMRLLGKYIDLDNTVVVVVADHGENLGEGGRWGHQHAVNDSLLRVPLLIRYPRRFPPGTIQEGQCQLVDIVPTLFEILEKESPLETSVGRSLVPESFVERQETFAQLAPYYPDFSRIERIRGFAKGIAPYDRHLLVLRTKTHKFISASNGERMLFDLRVDTDEVENLVELESELALELENRLAAYLESIPIYEAKAEAQDDAIPLEPDNLESLRALGYIQ